MLNYNESHQGVNRSTINGSFWVQIRVILVTDCAINAIVKTDDVISAILDTDHAMGDILETDRSDLAISHSRFILDADQRGPGG